MSHHEDWWIGAVRIETLGFSSMVLIHPTKQHTVMKAVLHSFLVISAWKAILCDGCVPQKCVTF